MRSSPLANSRGGDGVRSTVSFAAGADPAGSRLPKRPYARHEKLLTQLSSFNGLPTNEVHVFEWARAWQKQNEHFLLPSTAKALCGDQGTL